MYLLCIYSSYAHPRTSYFSFWYFTKRAASDTMWHRAQPTYSSTWHIVTDSESGQWNRCSWCLTGLHFKFCTTFDGDWRVLINRLRWWIWSRFLCSITESRRRKTYSWWWYNCRWRWERVHLAIMSATNQCRETSIIYIIELTRLKGFRSTIANGHYSQGQLQPLCNGEATIL